MPFDAIPSKYDPEELEQLKVFYDRRQKAAALWRSIPEKDFDIRHWTRTIRHWTRTTWRCGTTACALGWLALKKHDGWSLRTTDGVVFPVIDEMVGTDAAESYFGLGRNQAALCFGCDSDGEMIKRFYHVKARSHITPSQVANAVLKQTYMTGKIEFSADRAEEMIQSMEAVHAV